MGLIGDFKSILDIAEKLAQRHKQAKEEQNLNAVMMAMYKLSGEGSHSLDLQELVDFGFTKMQVFQATEQATARGWLIDCATFDSRYSWIPNQKACQYVEALLEAD